MRKLCGLALLTLLTVVLATQAGSGSGRSHGSGAKSSGGRSGSGTKPSGGSSFKPSPSGKSYGSGNKPSSPADAPASSKTYGSGTPKTAAPPAPGNQGKTYGSGGHDVGSGTTTGPPKGPASVPPQGKGSVDYYGQQARLKQESKAKYEASKTPASTYYDPKTKKELPLKADSPGVSHIRKTVTHETYVTRETRITSFYGPTILTGPVVYYSDPFGPFFYSWLLMQSLDQRAYWTYHHRQQMDDARYREMVTKDVQLETRIRALEQQKVARDPNYVPTAMKDNPDLMYSDQYVNAAYNPQVIPPPAPPNHTGHYVMWFALILMGFVVVGFMIWFVFVRET